MKVARSNPQKEIDNFIRSSSFRTVTDIIYVPEEQVAVVLRKPGHQNVTIDLSMTAASEVVEIIRRYKAVY